PRRIPPESALRDIPLRSKRRRMPQDRFVRCPAFANIHWETGRRVFAPRRGFRRARARGLLPYLGPRRDGFRPRVPAGMRKQGKALDRFAYRHAYSPRSTAQMIMVAPTVSRPGPVQVVLGAAPLVLAKARHAPLPSPRAIHTNVYPNVLS